MSLWILVAADFLFLDEEDEDKDVLLDLLDPSELLDILFNYAIPMSLVYM